MKKVLLGKSLHELRQIAVEYKLPAFTGKQIADWLYKKRVRTIDEMTNLSKAAREILSQDWEVGRVGYSQLQASVDGTKKYLFPVHTNTAVEAVMIPDEPRATICVSSQAGCKMSCRFCMTGRQGFSGNLHVHEILSQFMEIDEAEQLTNAVFMGMGEPLDNLANVLKTIEVLTAEWGFAWSPKRITLSSIGVTMSPQLIELPDYRQEEKNRGVYHAINPLKAFLDLTKCHLAISLHNPFPGERIELMPMEKGFPLEDTIDLI